MKQTITFITAVFLLIFMSCSNAKETNKSTRVQISTSFGDIIVELYDETPLHRDNFIKLVEDGFYDSLLFHRVINHFMIQGGDPDSKNAEAGKRLGNGGPGYKIPAEFNPKLFHKKGALAAAREPDRSNPEKASSGSQFYIVQGEVYSPGYLDTLEMKMNQGLQQQLLKQYFDESKDELMNLRKEGDQETFNIRVSEIREKVDSVFQAADKKTIPAERREAYTTIGGYPSLDGAYTVFGEVVEGLEIVDKIAAMEGDKRNRPVQDIKMEMKIIK